MGEKDEPPPFKMAANCAGYLSDSEMEQLIAEHEPLLTQSKLGRGHENVNVRRSQVTIVTKKESNHWLYQRVWEAAGEFNQRFFSADIRGFDGNIQIARYDSSDQGFYDWHQDFSEAAPERKISISVQLSRPEDYEGGDLELLFQNQPYQTERALGTFIAFPSFILHRVTPVTRGTRWSLVAWIRGPQWK